MHYQKPPYAQGKLVRVVRGAVLDVAVDLRAASPTYGAYQKVELSEENGRIFWMPEGFAHGFLVLTDKVVFQYKCTNFYHKDSEDSLIWNDPDVGIDWGIRQPLLSEKDAVAKCLKDINTPF